MASAPDNNSLLSDQDTNQFWCRNNKERIATTIQPNDYGLHQFYFVKNRMLSIWWHGQNEFRYENKNDLTQSIGKISYSYSQIRDLEFESSKIKKLIGVLAW